MKYLKIILVIAAILAIYFVVNRFLTKTHSPAATAHHEKDGLEITVEYCRPYKKNRAIFGGLVPYNKVWRTGANEATLIKFTKDVSLAGKKVKAGTYSLWTIPGNNSWTVILNQQTGQWGTEYDETKDVLRATVAKSALEASLEMLIIDFTDEANTIKMLIKWDKTQVDIPINNA
jgi:hypothetical protein